MTESQPMPLIHWINGSRKKQDGGIHPVFFNIIATNETRLNKFLAFLPIPHVRRGEQVC